MRQRRREHDPYRYATQTEIFGRRCISVQFRHDENAAKEDQNAMRPNSLPQSSFFRRFKEGLPQRNEPLYDDVDVTTLSFES